MTEKGAGIEREWRDQLRIVATAAFGLEAIVARELKYLGFKGYAVENGRVLFSGTGNDVARCNIRLRTADRVLVEVARFRAVDFEELFQGMLAVPWEEMLPYEARIHVTGKSVRSSLASVRDCQSVAKKAVIEAMKRRYATASFPENGPLYTIEVSLINDMVSVTIDTSGPGLHKRGYRDEAGDAPIKETLAAALVLLSGWRRHMTFVDPMCGSGTIPIEAALIGRNIAPGLYRSFVAETWPSMPAALWDEERKAAKDDVRNIPVVIVGADADDKAIQVARRNARRAGVDREVRFEVVPIERAVLPGEQGVVVCNPPYGERIGDQETIESLYRSMGRALLQPHGWSVSVLSAHPDFQRFFGKTADRNRKLYNGRIKCYLYQYHDRGHVARRRTVP